MGFFNPAFVWFMMGGAIPVIIHLLHRQRYRRVRWAAMDFLLAALKKTQRRLRLENLILLLIRILILVILALVIMRPFLSSSSIAGLGSTSTHYVFVFDTSYSMGYQREQKSSLEVAKQAAEDILNARHTSEEDNFTVLQMSDFPEEPAQTNKKNRAIWMITGKEEKQGRVVKTGPGIELSNFGGGVHRSLLALRDVLDRSRNVDREVYIFTDLQRLSWESSTDEEAEKFKSLLKELSGRERTRFYLFDAGRANADNYAAVSLRVEGKPLVTTRRSARFAADIYNFSNASLESVPVTLLVDDNPVETNNTFLEANTLTPVRFRYDFVEPGPHTVEVRLEPDFLRADDARFLALDVRRSVNAFVVDGEPGPGPESEVFYYNLVLDPTGQGRDFTVETITADRFRGEDVELEKYDFVVLANVPTLTEEKVEALEQFVESGGGLFIALGDRIDPTTYNQLLWKDGQGLLPAKIGELDGDPTEKNFRRFSYVKMSHPIFETFEKTDEKAGPFDLIFYQYYRLEGIPERDESRVLARFDDNFRSPGFVEKSSGKGKVILFSTSLDVEWNAGVPARPPYFVIMRSLSEYLAARPPARLNLQVGDPIQILIPRTVRAQEFTLTTPKPEESQLTVSKKKLPGTDKWSLVEYPTVEDAPAARHSQGVRKRGFYTLTKKPHPEDEPPLARFAANLSPADLSPESLRLCEGNLERIPWDEITRRFPDFKCEYLGERKRGTEDPDIRPPGGELWKHLLYLLLAFLLVESFLAWFFGRHKQ